MNNLTNIAIIGAGPYGLSLAAHLRAKHVEFRIFGRAMSFWSTQMPKGMLLKSEGDASSLSEPEDRFTLGAYCRERGIAYQDAEKPVELETFIQYGLEFQRRYVPQLDERLVRRVSSDPGGFLLELGDGEILTARRVVVAVGVGYFDYLPQCLAALPANYCSHSSRHRDLSAFQGRDVVVIGGGASAVDLTSLLHEASVHVRLIARRYALEIHQGPTAKARTLWQRIRHPRTGIGNSLRSLLLVKAPLAFHYLPQGLRLLITRRHLGPAGGWFMRERLIGKVPMLLSCRVENAQLREGRVVLTCQSGAPQSLEVNASHVIAATGFRVDLRRLHFIDDAILTSLRSVEHSPILSSQFESSLEGLHFIGPVAANSFGPVMRFAVGAEFAARRLSMHPAFALQQRNAASASVPSALNVS